MATWTTGNTTTNSTAISYATLFQSNLGQAAFEDRNNPVLRGDGPPECSSCTALSVLPVNIWDVNGYYRDLGVPTDANRRTLRQAYHRKNGQASHRLTYVLKQLLDEQVRFDYDRVPFGEIYLDNYVREVLNRKVKERMGQRFANLVNFGVDPDSVDEKAMQRDIYSEMGFEVRDEPGDDTPSPEVVAPTPEKVQTASSPAKFAYSYYLWRTRIHEDSEVLLRLGEWQRLLVSALAREGVTMRFAVGLHGEQNRWVEATIGYRTVFFLNQYDVPSQDLAANVARRVRSDLDRERAQQARQQQHSLAITER